MSTKVSGYVYEHSRMTGAAKFLLVVIADIVNDDGFGYGKLSTLQERTGLSRRWVQYNLRRLELAGEIEVLADPGFYHKFLVKSHDKPLDDRTTEAIVNIKQTPGPERKHYADWESDIYVAGGDRTRHSMNRIRRPRRQKEG